MTLQGRVGTATALLLGALSVALLVGVGAAAAGATGLTVGGVPLAGATVAPSSTVLLTAPATTSVSWVLDGVYLGRDVTAPFELALRTAAGPHKLKARAKTSSGTSSTYEVRFVTAAGGSGAPPTTPVPPPAPGDVRAVRTSAELVAALQSARPGQVLQLADGTYSGRFAIRTSGTAAAPVVLRGSRRAVLDGGATGSGYALHLDGAQHWRLEGFTVRGAQKGVVLDRSSDNVLSGIDVGRTGMEAVHFRSASSRNRLQSSEVHDTGLVEPGYGEGVYIGSAVSHWSKYGGGGPDRSDENVVTANRIWNTGAESIDVKEGTSRGVISDNSFDGVGMSGAHFADSWVDLKGNGYRVLRNSGVRVPLDGFQTHVQLAGWGRGNVLSGNVVTGAVPGYGIRLADPAGSPNTVTCDNSAPGALRGLANVRCV